MDAFLEFAKGPLFRLSFAIMGLGIIRLIVLAVLNGMDAKTKGADKKIPTQYVKTLTFGYLLPIRAFRTKPLYSLVSILFHIGLILTPILLFDHALLFEKSISISWIGLTLSKDTADFLTVMTIFTGVLLFLLRSINKTSRVLSRKQDFLWPLILIVPFITGFVCANTAINPEAYKAFMLVHILFAEFIFIATPFSKIAHCALLPFSQWITARSWKFTQQGPEDVIAALDKEGQKL